MLEGPRQGLDRISQLVGRQRGHLDLTQTIEQLTRFGIRWLVGFGCQPPLEMSQRVFMGVSRQRPLSCQQGISDQPVCSQ